MGRSEGFRASAEYLSAMERISLLKRLNDAYREDYALTRWDLDYGNLALRVEPCQPPRPTKCESCGSREFRQHAGRFVCSYCRSES